LQWKEEKNEKAKGGCGWSSTCGEKQGLYRIAVHAERAKKNLVLIGRKKKKEGYGASRAKKM